MTPTKICYECKQTKLVTEFITGKNICKPCKRLYRQNRKKLPSYHLLERSVWHEMRKRCHATYSKDYPRYGGRGIVICDRWLNSFDCFLEDMGERPSKNHSIERIDNDGNYEPGNCKWATPVEQARNRKGTLQLPYQGRLVSAAELSELTGIPHNKILKKIYAGKSIDEIIADHHKGYSIRTYKYKGSDKTISEISELTGMSKRALRYKLAEKGLSAEEAVALRDIRSNQGKPSVNDIISHCGEDISIKDLSKRTGIHAVTLLSRYKMGQRDEILVKPVQSGVIYNYRGNDYNLNELSRMSGIGFNTLRYRLQKAGMTIEEAMAKQP